MLVVLGSQRWDSPLFQKLWISLRDASRCEANPDCPSPRDRCSVWEEASKECSTVVKKPHVLGPQYQEISVLGEISTGLPLNNTAGSGIYSHIRKKNTRRYRFMLGISFVAKAKDYFTEDVTGVVTYRNSFYKLTHSTVDGSKMVAWRKQLKTTSEDKLTTLNYNIENFSHQCQNEIPEDGEPLIANSLSMKFTIQTSLLWIQVPGTQ